MNNVQAASNQRINAATVVGGALFVAGMLLVGVNWWFLLLCGLGAFGPGVLRELGWLNDLDEFQREASYRAGYHAYLAAGAVAFPLVAYFRSGDRDVSDPEELSTFFLVLLWFTWFLSSLLAYWGNRKGAARILIAFGSAWLAFTIASNVGSEWTGWAALLLHPLLSAPFFAAAMLAHRRPRLAGALSLAAGLGFGLFFGLLRSSGPGLVTRGVVFVLFLGPLIACGMALLAVKRSNDDGNEDEYAGVSMPVG